MHQFLEYTVSGLATSAIYAIAASGLVLTYTTTGIFNFAQGAIGMVAAFTYWQMRFGWGWPAPVAIIICLLILGPLFGAALDLGIMRRLEGAPEATRLVVTISLLVALLGLALWIWSPQVGRAETAFLPGDVVSVAGVRVSAQEIICLVIAAVLAVGLRLFLFRTRTGIAMRAAVDDRPLARLTGARPNRGSLLAWAIGVSLAALSGILIAPTLSLSAVPLTLLIVNAYAAAIFGRLRSLPMTFLGALILGLAGEYLPDYLQSSSGNQYLQGLYVSIPVVLLFIVLLVMPHPHLRGHVTARGREIIPRPTWRGAGTFFVAIVAGSAMIGSILSRPDLEASVGLFGLAIVALSLVPLAGFAGQISLCQLTLAGIGAMMMGHFGVGGSPWGLVAAVVVPGAIGALVALPALRLTGLYLALATAAFAVIMDQWIFVLPPFTLFGHTFNVFNNDSLTVSFPKIFGLQPVSTYGDFVFMAVAFALCAMVVVVIRRSNFGSRLLAAKDSPAAVVTLGLNLTRTKVAVFAIAAAMAGLGGALYAGSAQVVSASQFSFFVGLPLLLVLVVAGVGTLGGALFAGIFVGSPIFGNLFHSFTELPTVLAGLAGIGMGRDPNGFLIRTRHEWEVVGSSPWGVLGVGGVLVGLWLLRIGGVIASWPYAVLSLAVLLGTPPLVSLWLRRHRPADVTAGHAEGHGAGPAAGQPVARGRVPVVSEGGFDGPA